MKGDSTGWSDCCGGVATDGCGAGSSVVAAAAAAAPSNFTENGINENQAPPQRSFTKEKNVPSVTGSLSSS